MARKKKQPPQGAPDWVMTFGDMMSLLLTFFILLVSLSEIKKEDDFRQFAEEVIKAFGNKGGGGRLPTQDDPTKSLIKTLEELQLRRQRMPHRSRTIDQSIEGIDPMVTRIREGKIFAVGGPVMFEPGRAALTEPEKRKLRRVAGIVRGYNTKIELRGHTASMEPLASAEHDSLLALSHARGVAVMEYLVSPDCRISPRRIRVVANADREPLRKRAYDPASQQPNRRVEIIVNEAVVAQFAGTESIGP